MAGRLDWVVRACRVPVTVYAGEDDSLRHATWLELFFDLVFVVAIAELGHQLHGDATPVELLEFAGVFMLVWWIWMDFSYYADMYETDDPFSSLTMIAAMFVIILLSQSIDGVFHGDSFAFTVAIVVLRLVLTGLYSRAREIETEAKEFLTYWTASEVLTTFTLVVALFVPEPARFGLWAAAFVINVGGVSVLYTVFEPVVVQVSHFPERLGLMTIIVLGETILAVSFGTSIGPITGPGQRALTRDDLRPSVLQEVEGLG